MKRKVSDKSGDSEVKSKFRRNVMTKLGVLIIAAIASYVFYFLMARMLSVENYGLLYSLIALTYLFTVPHETIRAVIARYTVDWAAKKEYGKMKGFFIAALKNVFIYSAIAFVIFMVLLPVLMELFHASLTSMIIIGSSLLVTLILPLIWGLLQGMQSFGHLGINNSIEGVAKLAIAIVLVLLGFGVNGALIAIPLSLLIAFFAGFWPIKDILKAKTEKFRQDHKHIIRYFIAAFVIFLFFVALYSLDTIMARYFFSAKTSGFYGSLSVLSKVVLFISIAITRVMFSAVAEKSHSKNKKIYEKQYKEGKQILLTAGLYILIVIGFFLIISIFAPELLIKIVVGGQYLEIAPNLKYMIIAMGFLSLSSLIAFYNLSLDWNKRITARILGTFVFLQIASLIVFHRTLQQFITVVLIINSLLFLAMLATLLIKKRKPSVIVNK